LKAPRAAFVVACGALLACGERPRIAAPPPGASAPQDVTAGATAAATAPGPEPDGGVARVDEGPAPAEDSASAQRVRPARRKGQEKPKDDADAPPPAPEDRWMQCEQYDVDFRGKNLRTLRIGKPGNPEVLLLHGARFNCRTWLENGTLEFLAKNGLRAVAIDLPGYGKSKDVPPDPENFLFHALPFLDLKKPVVVFPSMSGTFAFPLAVAHPEQVAGLVPVAPVGIDEFAPKLKSLELRALLVWGENDTVVPISKADVLKDALANAEKLVIPRASHACYQDEPQMFQAALLKFVRSVQPKK
jgi:abhydrolase domain-containing protein 14